MSGPLRRRRHAAPDRLFYNFCLDDRVPADHLLCAVNRFLELGSLRRKRAGHYRNIGRASADPALIRRLSHRLANQKRGPDPDRADGCAPA